MERIALGTVQFGQLYGIANSTGVISKEEAARIIKYARENHVDMLDTAVLYGNSEKLLGETGIADFKIISKLPSVPPDCRDIPVWINESVIGSLNNLCIPSLYGLLLHHAGQLSGTGGSLIYNSLTELKKKGIIKKIGASLYDVDEIEPLISNYSVDIIQLPFNILDQRLVLSGWLDRLTEKKIEVHVRSIFLQGLLLMMHGSRPDKFSRWSSTVWNKYDSWLSENKISSIQACLQFVLSFPKITRVIMGVDSLAHFKELLSVAGNRHIDTTPVDFQSNDIMLINPAKWKDL